MPPSSDYSARASSGADAARRAVQSGLLVPPVVGGGGGGLTQIFVTGAWGTTIAVGGAVFLRTFTAPAAGGGVLYLMDGEFRATAGGFMTWRLEVRAHGGAAVRTGISQVVAHDGSLSHFASWLYAVVGDLTPGVSYDIGLYIDELDGGGTASLGSSTNVDLLFSVLPG